MNYLEIEKRYQSVCSSISEKQLKNAFEILTELVVESQNGDFTRQLENYKDTFTNMLKYTFEQKAIDPEKEKIYHHLVRSVLELADKTREYIITKRRLRSNTEILMNIAGLPALSAREIDEIIKSLSFQDEIDRLKSSKKDITTAIDRDEIMAHVFNLFWAKDEYKDAEMELGKKIMSNDKIPWYEKSIIISAITLSFLRYFDVKKFDLLLVCYENAENQVWQRAFVGLVIILCHYDRRLALYPEIVKKLLKYVKQEKFKKYFDLIIIQLLKARETEKITKKFQEEIVPEMMKFKPRIENKLDLDNIISDSFSEDKNPDWENFFKDSPGLFDKLEEFSRMQLEGTDVFMGTFSMLKHFDFFKVMRHWFLPFYKENDVVQNTLSSMGDNFDIDAFSQGLERTAFLCNSDKYSFCLNVHMMPQEQKTLMLEMFNMEINAMNEVSKDDELLNQTAKDNFIFTQYIQDYYRFCKLFPQKHEYVDVFSGEKIYHKVYILHEIFKDNDIIRNIAEFYFEKEYYDLAIEAFSMLLKSDSNIEIFQKIAYSYQMLQQYDNALEYYHKAELFDKNKSWNFRKIAQCYRKLKVYDKALEYYLRAEKLGPDNLYTQSFLGHTYLDLKEYEKALQYYFKVEYLAPDNYKIHRPIAWCSFALGKFESAQKYITKVLEKNPSKHDFLMAGHIFWCSKDKIKAIENYRKSIKTAKNDFEWFEKEFAEDTKYLTEHEISQLEISLMIDYIKYFSK